MTSQKNFDPSQFTADLAQFTGTEYWYKTMNPRFTYTDGVKFVATECGAYWMIDYIVSYQSNKTFTNEDFQVWKFTKTSGDALQVNVTNGNNGLIQETEIEYTDFPMQSIEIWVVNGVILLPSEY